MEIEPVEPTPEIESIRELLDLFRSLPEHRKATALKHLLDCANDCQSQTNSEVCNDV